MNNGKKIFKFGNHPKISNITQYHPDRHYFHTIFIQMILAELYINDGWNGSKIVVFCISNHSSKKYLKFLKSMMENVRGEKKWKIPQLRADFSHDFQQQ